LVSVTLIGEVGSVPAKIRKRKTATWKNVTASHVWPTAIHALMLRRRVPIASKGARKAAARSFLSRIPW